MHLFVKKKMIPNLSKIPRLNYEIARKNTSFFKYNFYVG